MRTHLYSFKNSIWSRLAFRPLIDRVILFIQYGTFQPCFFSLLSQRYPDSCYQSFHYPATMATNIFCSSMSVLVCFSHASFMYLENKYVKICKHIFTFHSVHICYSVRTANFFISFCSCLYVNELHRSTKEHGIRSCTFMLQCYMIISSRLHANHHFHRVIAQSSLIG